jgi:2-hydroxychromene-2-carboxylate isomerase
MAKVIECFFTPVSPWSYLGGERLEAMAKRHGATIDHKPCDFGKVMSVSGGLPLAQRPKQRQAYRLHELERWRDHLGITINFQPKYAPRPPSLAANAIIAAKQQGGDVGRFANAVMRACWAEERDIGDPATVKAIARECGLDGETIVAASGSPEVQRAFDANTEEAIDRQVFGAPWYIYKDKPYWGQDRLDFLDRALAAG